MKRIRLFVRTWWRKEGGKLVPGPGRKRTVRIGIMSEDEARRACQMWFWETHGDQGAYNRTLKQHRGLKMEWEFV